jgi:branched-chain amino acid transport system substrate-binding protein
VIPWLTPENAARFVQTARSLGANFTIIANDAAYGDTTFGKLAGSAADGTISFGLKAIISPSPQLKEYEAKYKEMFHAKADIYGAQTYDSVMMLAKAIEESESTEAGAIRDALEGMTKYSGITGSLGFSKTKHEALEPNSFQQIEYSAASGEWEPVGG